MPLCIGGKLSRAFFAVDLAVHLRLCGGKDFAISRQRQQRPAVTVHVVLQIENLWEPCPGSFVFRPGTVLVLLLNEEFYSALDAGPRGIIERAQTHHRPRSLRSGTGPLAFENRIVISIATLTPPAVL